MISRERIEILKKELGFEINEEIIEKLDLWYKNFVQYNEHTNLMSSNDVKVIFEKHVFDSLSILKWDEFNSVKKILDVGTGGGFPSVIFAICFPEKTIIANDSRVKKIKFINEIKNTLKLNNLEIVYARIEDVSSLGVDLIVSRAVGSILDVFEFSKKHIGKKGKFLIYKSKTIKSEIENFKNKYKNAEFNIIPYKLPLEENFERNLVVLENLY